MRFKSSLCQHKYGHKVCYLNLFAALSCSECKQNRTFSASLAGSISASDATTIEEVVPIPQPIDDD